jgi:hypothetical protein
VKRTVPFFADARQQFHNALLASILTQDENGVVSNADDGNSASVAIALAVAECLGSLTTQKKTKGQTAGKVFENECRAFLSATFSELGHLRPGAWSLQVLEQRDKLGIARFEQYAHLSKLAKAAAADPELAAVLGNDYLITPDIVVFREPVADEEINRPKQLVDDRTASRSPLRKSSGSQLLIHSSVSCKWTLRSDRAQNARSEALNLIRNRKGRVPHIVSITGEPLPGRIASLALGTSDLDCVYHFALPELLQVVTPSAYPDAYDTLRMLVDGKRLRDIADLPLDMCI